MKKSNVLRRNTEKPFPDEGKVFINNQFYRYYKFYLTFFVILFIIYGFIKNVDTLFLIPVLASYWAIQFISLLLITKNKKYILGSVINIIIFYLSFRYFIPLLTRGGL